jgi:hypothetical protein
MEKMNTVVAVAFVAVFVIAVYFILPKTKYGTHRANIMRGLIFFILIGYLAWDFYMKEKYLFIAFLAVASCAVVYALRNAFKSEQ